MNRKIIKRRFLREIGKLAENMSAAVHVATFTSDLLPAEHPLVWKKESFPAAEKTIMAMQRFKKEVDRFIRI